MKARLQNLWENLRTSFWFVPALMALASAGLSFGTVAIDSRFLGGPLPGALGWLWSGGASGARSLLSTVASSMITVAGTVFSITIAALTLASSQFGPRLLRNFTRDTGNQLVLGTFISTFLYCLLVLRTVRDESEGGFVPNLSVSCGVLLAVASLGVLIYFIHHVAGSIQAESLIALVGEELKADIARLHTVRPRGSDTTKDADPQPHDGDNHDGDNHHAADDDQAIEPPDRDDPTIPATASGYIQSLDHDTLLATAEEHDLLISILQRPGDFISRGDPLLRVRVPQGKLSENQVRRLRNAFSVGTRRTPTQDIRYGIRQLTEIGSRALSPGINDPFTAAGCADWLADALAELDRCEQPPSITRDEGGKPRLIETPLGFAEAAHLSFGPLSGYGATSAIVMVHLLQVMARLAGNVAPDRHGVLLREAEQCADAARQQLKAAADLQRIDEALLQVRLATGEAGTTSTLKPTGNDMAKDRNNA